MLTADVILRQSAKSHSIRWGHAPLVIYGLTLKNHRNERKALTTC